jgi:hypothetical protein
MFGSKMFRVAHEVEPQRDAAISSSNMKPVKCGEMGPVPTVFIQIEDEDESLFVNFNFN